MISCSKYCALVKGSDKKYYAIGRSRQSHFMSDNNSTETFKDVSPLFETVRGLEIVE
jgi:hypothetical protein